MGVCNSTPAEPEVRIPLPLDRETFTTDVNCFDEYVAKTIAGRPDHCAPLWAYLRGLVFELSEPIGLLEFAQRSGEQTAVPEALINKFGMRVFTVLKLKTLHPPILAQAIQASTSDVIRELMHASATGMCTLHWQLPCNACGSHTNLDVKLSLPKSCQCEVCGRHSAIRSACSIRAAFVLNQDVFYTPCRHMDYAVSKKMFGKRICGMPIMPTNDPKKGFSYVTLLPAGSYRVFCGMGGVDASLSIKRDATPLDNPVTMQFNHSSILEATLQQRKFSWSSEHGSLRFEGFADSGSFVGLGIYRDFEDSEFTLGADEVVKSSSAADILCLPELQEVGRFAVNDSKFLEELSELKLVDAADESMDAAFERRKGFLESGKYIRMKLIGRGTTGAVFKCLLPDGTIIAVKDISIPDAEDGSCASTALTDVQREIEIISTLRHPNLVVYYASQYAKEDQQIAIFMELVSGGSLGALLRQSGVAISEALAATYARQLLDAIAYCHKQGVLHRDIKCDNVLVDTDGTLKLADFGASKKLDTCVGDGTPQTQTMVGTPLFMAPEMLGEADQGYSFPADVWSFGITVLELLDEANTPWPPFPSIGAALMYIANPDASPIVPERLSDACKDFVAQCCTRNPANRPTAEQLLTHPWLAQASPSSSDKYRVKHES